MDEKYTNERKRLHGLEHTDTGYKLLSKNQSSFIHLKSSEFQLHKILPVRYIKTLLASSDKSLLERGTAS